MARRVNNVVPLPSAQISPEVLPGFDYRDKDGQILARLVVHSDGKRFLIDPHTHTRLLKRDTDDLPLFNLPLIEFQKLKGVDATVYVCSNEQDATTIHVLCSIVTTTVPPTRNGSKRQRWHSRFTRTVQGVNVVLLADNSKQSKNIVRAWAKVLHLNAASVKIVHFDDVLEGQGPRHYVFTHGKDAFLQKVAETSEYRPNPRLEKLFAFTDDGNGERFAHYTTDRVKVCHEDGKEGAFHVFNGRVWESNSILAQQQAEEVVKRIPDEVESYANHDEQQAVLDWHQHSQKAASIKNMLYTGRSKVGRIYKTDFDRDPNLFNAANGTIDLQTGELKPFNSNDLLTRISPINYDSKAECPRWIRFIEEICDGDVDLIECIHRIVGYAATGRMDEQVFFVLFGRHGNNGKSTFLDVVSEVLGSQYAGKLATSWLYSADDGRQGGQTTPEVIRLLGTRLAYASEGEPGRRLSTSRLKEVTGDGVISARALYGDQFDAKPTFKVFFATNHKPTITETTHAIWRRVVLIPFEAKFSGEQIDKNLKQKLMGEAPGILRWIVDGALKWYAHGLGTCSVIEQATREYQRDSDPVGRFLDERCEIASGSTIQSSDLYGAFGRWWMESCEGEPPTIIALSKSLLEKGYTKVKKDKIHWHNISLKTDK